MAKNKKPAEQVAEDMGRIAGTAISTTAKLIVRVFKKKK